MIALLADIKTRLGLSGNAADEELTRILEAVGSVFDQSCQRRFERNESAEQLFQADEREVPLLWYPVEIITSIQSREHARAAWTRETVKWEITAGCILTLESAIGDETETARVLYVGGYVPPGTTAESYQVALPKDIEQAALDQAAYWYENRHSLRGANPAGRGATTRQAGDLTLLPHVEQILNPYRRLRL